MKTASVLAGCLVLLAMGFLGVANARAEDTTTFKVSDFTFTRPAAWEWVPVTSSMRAAQLRVPAKGGGEPADVVFFYFGPGSAGGTQANVDRWLRQFEESRDKINPKIESETIGGHKVTFVQASGTYASGMPGGPMTPKSDYGLLGAVIDADSGSVFVKMTGPKDLVNSSAADFHKMIESALKG